MLKITRTLQKQIDEKDAVIQKYEKQLVDQTNNEQQARRNQDEKYDTEKNEMARKQEADDEH